MYGEAVGEIGEMFSMSRGAVLDQIRKLSEKAKDDFKTRENIEKMTNWFYENKKRYE